MIDLGGRPYFPYIIYTDHGPVMGLDPRSSAEIEREWLARARRGAERRALNARGEARSNVHNLRLLQRKVDGDPITGAVLTDEGTVEPVTLDEVAPPPAESFDEDEVLRLSGLPDGYGYVAMIAACVSGVSRAGGAEADDFCAGVDTWFAAPRRRKGVGKKKARGRKQ